MPQLRMHILNQVLGAAAGSPPEAHNNPTTTQFPHTQNVHNSFTAILSHHPRRISPCFLEQLHLLTATPTPHLHHLSSGPTVHEITMVQDCLIILIGGINFDLLCNYHTLEACDSGQRSHPIGRFTAHRVHQQAN